jgi:ADP-heptose:LPS heptosyltransferase
MNIALVKLSAIGDVVHALPVAAALHAALPQARLVWIVERREAAVLRDNPALSEVVPVDTRGWRRARRPLALAEATRALVALRRHLRASRFDVAIDHRDWSRAGDRLRPNAAADRFGAACREGLNVLFTNQRWRRRRRRVIVDRYLSLVEPLGARARSVGALPTDETARRIDEFLIRAGQGAGPPGGAQPGARRPAKRWSTTEP